MPERARAPVLPLAGRTEMPRPGLALSELGPIGQITLRVEDVAAPAVSVLVSKLMGAPAPGALSVSLAEDGRRVVWMATDELLLLMPHSEVDAALAKLAKALDGTHHLALDVSDARAVLRLEGADAAETLAKGVPLDVSEAAFPVGCARRTHLGGLAVGLWRIAPETWEIVCFRSFAHHLFDWLAVSGREGAAVGRFG